MPRIPLGRRFHLLWAGQTASLLGDQVTLIALPFVAVTVLHAGTVEVGLIGACLRVPFLVIGLAAGVWVTRAGLLASMTVADIARGAAVLLVPILLAAGVHSLAALYACALVIGLGTVFFQIAYQSAVPDLVDDEGHWHAANTRLSLSESSSLVAGPALGGGVIAWAGASGALSIDAATYAVSVLTLVAILLHRRRPHAEPVVRGSLGGEIRAGIAYVRGNRVLNTIMWVGCWYNLGASMYDALLVLFAVRELHLSPATLGLSLGIGAIGFPIGSALSGWVKRRSGGGRALLWAAVPSVLGIVIGSVAGGAAAALMLGAGTFVIGLGQGVFTVNAITLRQANSERSMRAQATAVHRFLSWGALSVGAVLAGVIGQVAGIRVAMVLSGLVAAASFWPLLTSPLVARTGPAVPTIDPGLAPQG